MNETLDLMVILDRSGSMKDRRADHEGGLRSFVQDQKELPGDVRFTFVQFDTHNPCDVVYSRVPMTDVEESRITLTPRGGTPLLDAIGRSVATLVDAIGREDANVICMIVTDGEENESREWTKTRVAERIKELEQKGWKFLYLGANVDAFHEAGSVGIGAMRAVTYTASAAGIGNTYTVLSNKLGATRSRALTGESYQEAIGWFAMDEPERHAAAGATYTTLSVPLFITNSMKKQLDALGYAKTDIYTMTPEQAWTIITNHTTKEPTQS